MPKLNAWSEEELIKSISAEGALKEKVANSMSKSLLVSVPNRFLKPKSVNGLMYLSVSGIFSRFNFLKYMGKYIV